LIVTGCIFTENSAYSDYGGAGGGIYNGYNLKVTNCTFIGNRASSGPEGFLGVGGGICNYYGNTAVTNCTFIGNRAYSVSGYEDAGGGIYISSEFNPVTVTNCTFSGNWAYSSYGSYSGGIYTTSWEWSPAEVNNCILWDNEGEQIYDLYGGIVVNYSDIQNGWTGYGGNNIDADPCFVELGYWDDVNDPNTHDGDPNDPNSVWVNGNYRLLPGSPCIDAGDNNSVPADYADLDDDNDVNEPTPLDLDGFPRFIDGDCNDSNVVDMGAYEFLCSDIDHSGSVNFEDFAGFALQWLEYDCGSCFGADLTCDGSVDMDDLNRFVLWWLAGIK
jgi:hypothetical protein